MAAPATPGTGAPSGAVARAADAERQRELGATAAAATRITPADLAALPSFRAAYSDRTALLMAELAAIAYLRFEPAPPDGWSDPAAAAAEHQSFHARLAAAGFGTVRTYAPYDAHETRAYLAMGPKLAALVFRGSKSAANWRDDFDAEQVPVGIARTKIRIHRGFWLAFESVRGRIEADLAELAADPVKIPIHFVGHSLGGALAQIATAVFDRDELAACYTFGSPRVSETLFDTLVKSPHYRVVNRYDIVPRTPLIAMGYSHTGDARTLTDDRTPPRRGAWLGWRFYAELAAALVAYLRGGEFVLAADHAIARYIEKLGSIAAARNTDPERWAR